MADDLVARLRVLSRHWPEIDDAPLLEGAAEIERLTARITRLEAALRMFAEAALYDALMEGPRFKGWNRSQLERARLITFGMLIDEKDPAHD